MPTLTITAVQRSELRSQAHALNPTIIIGADGLTPAVIKETEKTLAVHELIKIRVLGDDRQNRLSIYEQLCDQLSAAPIQHIGKLLILWRPGKRKAAPVKPVSTDSSARGKAPALVKVIKPSRQAGRRATVKNVVVLGNERVTAGGLVKRAKPARQKSTKRPHA